MNNTLPEFNVSSGYLISEADVITDFDRKIVTELYLPMVGSVSVSLYFWLLENLPNQVSISERSDHNQILDVLSLSKITFIQARQKLEAVGLLSTNYHRDQMGDVYVYTLVPPMPPAIFFKDQLLSNFLYSLIGDSAYLDAQKKFALKKLHAPIGSNISANFLEVFNRVSDNPRVNRKQLNDLSPQEIKRPDFSSNFDFDFLSTQLKSKGVNQLDIDQNHDALVSLHLVYGLDELELLRIIESNITLDSFEINLEAIKHQLYNNNSTNVAINPSNQTDHQYPALNKTQQDLAMAATNASPLEFIAELKMNLGGFVSASEKAILQQMIENKILTTPVLNILVHQILVGMKKASLNKSLVETIANQWTREGVTDATQAIYQVNKFNQDKQTAKSKNTNSRLRKVEQEINYQQVEDDNLNVNEVLDKFNSLQKNIGEDEKN